MKKTTGKKVAGSLHNVRAVTRALKILHSFAKKPQQSLAEVTTATGLDKGTTRRLLLTLVDSGFVMVDPASQHYRLGVAIRDLASSVPDVPDLRSLSIPILSQLAGDLHMTAFLSIYSDGSAVCLERLHDMKGIEVRWWAVGARLPYNCGAAPKLLLAFQTKEEIERALATAPTAMTPKSTTDANTLRRHFATIRRRAWEFAADDVALGLAAVAVPVFHKDGSIACAISIAGLTPQFATRGKPAHLERLLDAARAIEKQLPGTIS